MNIPRGDQSNSNNNNLVLISVTIDYQNECISATIRPLILPAVGYRDEKKLVFVVKDASNGIVLLVT